MPLRPPGRSNVIVEIPCFRRPCAGASAGQAPRCSGPNPSVASGGRPGDDRTAEARVRGPEVADSRCGATSCSGRPIGPGRPSRSGRPTTRSCRSVTGSATKTVDYIDRAGLVEKYRDFKQYSPDDIEDVDYVIPAGALDVGRDPRAIRPGARVARPGAQHLADRLPQRLHEPPGPGRRPVARRPRPSLLLRPVSRALVHRTRHRHVARPTVRPHRRHHDRVLAQCRQASRHDVMVGRPHGELPVRPRPRRGQGERGTSARATRTSTSTIGSSRPTTSA